MTRALLLTHWVGTGATRATARRPRLPQVFSLSLWVDRAETPAAALPPSPNLVALEAEATEAVLDQIEASGAFGPAHILLAPGRRPEGSVPNAAEFIALRARLASLGAGSTDIDDAVGTAVASRTRRQIARRLLAWLRSR